MKVTDPTDLSRRLLERVLEDAGRRQPGTLGGWGAVQRLPRRRRVADALLALAERLGLSRRRLPDLAAAGALAAALERAPELARTEELLADRESRALLLTVLSLRALGPRHVALPEPRFRAGCARVERELRVEAEAVPGPRASPCTATACPDARAP